MHEFIFKALILSVLRNFARVYLKSKIEGQLFKVIVALF